MIFEPPYPPPNLILSYPFQIVYEPSYSRCIFGNIRPLAPVLMLLVPLMIITFLYGIMVVFIIRNRIPVGQLLKTTTAILFTGIATIIPEVLISTFNLEMSYEVAQVLTITLYHTNCIYNPIIYFISNPRVTPQLKNRVRRLTASNQEH